ncbi:DUF624 domain-containing protein [Microbacterium sp. NPDC076911]|uniref:DUF624 domain-containing protein n=1 Tax=Microbacterium sp. NPDC076911 TaxID=3154958 RepID=UPI003448C5F3
MTMVRARPPARKSRWESSLLSALATPANIVLGGVAAFLLGLGIITALPAMIALARALTRWMRDKDDAVFTNTFREFASTWRRSLPLGIFAAFVTLVLAADVFFLLVQMTTGSSTLVIVFAAAAVPIGVVFLLMLLAVPVAASRLADETRREWMNEVGNMLLRHPGRSFAMLVVGAAITVGCALLPTLIPFVALSLPVYAGLRIWGYQLDSPAAE